MIKHIFSYVLLQRMMHIVTCLEMFQSQFFVRWSVEIMAALQELEQGRTSSLKETTVEIRVTFAPFVEQI